VTCVLQLVCCNCVTCVLQLVCVAIQVWSCCNCVTPCVAIELLQMQLRCNCVVIVCSSRCNWELIATGCCNCCVNCNMNLNCKLGCNSKGGRFVVPSARAHTSQARSTDGPTPALQTSKAATALTAPQASGGSSPATEALSHGGPPRLHSSP
jgi:hypothetical protein